MRLELIKRPEHSRLMTLVSPLLALGLTVVFGGLLFAALGHDPLAALHVYFIEPWTEIWSLEEIVVKATPLVLIALGLSVCFLANTWNIGAEGQFTAGAILGALLPIVFHGWESSLLLPLMLLLGTLGGMAWAAIPAILRTRFGANEILVSLMLVYVAQLLLDWLVRGPWRDPDGYNFPESRLFVEAGVMPALSGRVHGGTILALIAVLVMGFLLARSLKGFEIKVVGAAPRAAAFAGFSRSKTVLGAFLISGGLAGLAGIAEVSGSIGQLRPTISPGYGFTAIIVAFLGRLNPIGILFAGLLLALTYIGGESAQIVLGISDKIGRVFQGMILFFVLGCDTFIRYRLRWAPSPPPGAKVERSAAE